jgi:hypothetical protein
MYRVLCVILLGMTCATRLAAGADFPTFIHNKIPAHSKKPSPPKSRDFKPQKTAIKLQPSTVIPKKSDTAIKDAPSISPEVTLTNFTWVLKPLVANADGGKNEGSASETGNMIVEKPGMMICSPEMLIDLQGHIVKTVNSTVRLDIQVGEMRRSVVWHPNAAESGKFNITLKENAQGCLPGDYIPVSALAFVTKDGDGHAAMVSLEKIVLRYEGTLLTGSQ